MVNRRVNRTINKNTAADVELAQATCNSFDLIAPNLRSEFTFPHVKKMTERIFTLLHSPYRPRPPFRPPCAGFSAMRPQGALQREAAQAGGVGGSGVAAVSVHWELPVSAAGRPSAPLCTSLEPQGRISL